MSMIIPDPRFEAPELFEPGRKPTGPFVIADNFKNYDLRYYLLNGGASLDRNQEVPIYQTIEDGELVISQSDKWVEIRKNNTVLDGSTTATFFVDLVRESGSNIFSRWAGYGDVRRQFITLIDGATSRLILVVATTGALDTWYGRYFDTTPLAPGGRYKIAISVNGKNFICYINGQLQAQTSWIDNAFTGFSSVVPATHPIQLGKSFDTTDAVIGRYKSFFVTDKLLPSSLLRNFTTDPYQLLIPA